MKKILAVALVAGLSGSAMAANSVGFDFGTNFFKPATTGFSAQNGQNFTINWNLDNDVSVGVYTETSNVNGGGAVVGALNVSAIQVSKGVMKGVNVGLNLGSGTNTGAGLAVAPTTAPLADVFGKVAILSGSGDKVSGALNATLAARFITTGNYTNGYNLGLSVAIWF